MIVGLPCFSFKVGQQHGLLGTRDMIEYSTPLVINDENLSRVDLATLYAWRGKPEDLDPKFQGRVTFISHQRSIHIARSQWSRFTQILREYLLPFVWKSAYLRMENEAQPKKILVRINWLGDRTFEALTKNLLGKPLFTACLIESCRYRTSWMDEYLAIPSKQIQTTEFTHFFGFYMSNKVVGKCRYSHIYRSRNLFTEIRYLCLKHFSSNWAEMTITFKYSDQPNDPGILEKILIRKEDSDQMNAAYAQADC